MDNSSILDKGNSIKVNFVVNSKLDVIPVLFCCMLVQYVSTQRKRKETHDNQWSDQN